MGVGSVMTFRGGHAPLGYDQDRVRKCLVVNDDEAEVVRVLFALYPEQRSLSRLAKMADERGWISKRTGKPLSRRAIHDILTNPVYLGKYRAGDEVVDGVHPAIIDAKLFDEIQELLHASSDTAGRFNGNSAEEAWLSDILRCHRCNGSMRRVYAYQRDGDKEERYRCADRFHQEESCQELSLGMAEYAVFDQLQAWLFRQPALPTLAMRAVYGMGERIESLRRQVVLQQRAYDEGRLVLEALLEQRVASPSQLQHQRESLESMVRTREMIEEEIHRLTVLRMSEDACLKGMQAISGAKSSYDMDHKTLHAVLAMLARRVLVTGIPYHAHIEYYEHLGGVETLEKNTKAK